MFNRHLCENVYPKTGRRFCVNHYKSTYYLHAKIPFHKIPYGIFDGSERISKFKAGTGAGVPLLILKLPYIVRINVIVNADEAKNVPYSAYAVYNPVGKLKA